MCRCQVNRNGLTRKLSFIDDVAFDVGEGAGGGDAHWRLLINEHHRNQQDQLQQPRRTTITNAVADGSHLRPSSFDSSYGKCDTFIKTENSFPLYLTSSCFTSNAVAHAVFGYYLLVLYKALTVVFMLHHTR